MMFHELRFQHFFVSGSSPRFSVLLLPGRATFIEQYFEVIDELYKLNCDVWIVDLPAQGGSGRGLKDPQKMHINTFNEYPIKINQFITEVFLPYKRTDAAILFGISLGGLCAISTLIRYPKLQTHFSRLILAVPLIDVKSSLRTQILRFFLEILPDNNPIKNNFIYGYGIQDPFSDFFLNDYPNYNEIRFNEFRNQCIKYPQYLVGGPTIGWAYCLLKELLWLDNLKNAKINTDSLVVLAQKDSIVSNIAIKNFLLPKLTNHKDIVIKDAPHTFFLASNAIWQNFWLGIKNYLES